MSFFGKFVKVLSKAKQAAETVSAVVDIVDVVTTTQEGKDLQFDIGRGILAGEQRLLDLKDFEQLNETEEQYLDEAVKNLTIFGLLYADRMGESKGIDLIDEEQLMKDNPIS